jgi:hypothetical protein
MTDHAPIDQPILEILNTYNPLEIKDILLHGSWRKATKHKDWDKVLAYYKDNIDYMHHYLLDSPDAWNHYGMMQKAYTMTDHTPQDQKDYQYYLAMTGWYHMVHGLTVRMRLICSSRRRSYTTATLNH